MTDALEKTKLNSGSGSICANVDGDIYKSESYCKPLLVQQIEGRVRWTLSLANLNARAKDLQSKNDSPSVTFIEVGPGAVLRGLVKKTLSQDTAFPYQLVGTDSVELLAEAIIK